MIKENFPEHIAIIMDGNGRWAKKRRLPRIFGHRQGAQAIKRVVNASFELGIKYLTLYTFSTENWKRPKREVSALMRMLVEYIDRRKKIFKNYEKIKVEVTGRWWELPSPLPDKINLLIEETKYHNGLTLILAINYGGRREILDAVEKIIKKKRKRGFYLDEENFRNYLYLPNIPDPDLLIRTGGEHRVSNFLLWQISYTEIYITAKLWPDFRKADLIQAIKFYQKRERKFGGL
jgi:undecaprenyl diphosphate synthase